MAKTQQSVVVLGILVVSAVAGLIVLNGRSGTSGPGQSDMKGPQSILEKKTLEPVRGPELSDESLSAQATMAGGFARRTEVQVTGRMHHAPVDEVVFRSQESPDLLRLGWESADHLVISVPQFPQDAGKAVGAGDPVFLCGAQSSAVLRVTCDTYPVGTR